MPTADITLHDHDREIQYELAVRYQHVSKVPASFGYYGGDPGTPEEFIWTVARVDFVRFRVLLKFNQTGGMVYGWCEAQLTPAGCEAVAADIDNRSEEFDDQVAGQLRKFAAGRN